MYMCVCVYIYIYIYSLTKDCISTRVLKHNTYWEK